VTHLVHSLPISISHSWLANLLQTLIKKPPGLLCREVANHEALKEAWSNLCMVNGKGNNRTLLATDIYTHGSLLDMATSGMHCSAQERRHKLNSHQH